MTSFGKMYETKDLKGVEKTLHPDLSYFGIGTAEDEIRLNEDDAVRMWERDFNQINRVEDFVIDMQHFDSLGEVAWVISTIDPSIRVDGPCRVDRSTDEDTRIDV